MKFTYHADGTRPICNPKTVFVFGSNLKGYHGAGAALLATQKYGAAPGMGAGWSGNSYAVPTKCKNLHALPLDDIQMYAECFCIFSNKLPHMEYFVTAVGTGFAGYKHEQIAPMFRSANPLCSFPEEWYEFLELEN